MRFLRIVMLAASALTVVAVGLCAAAIANAAPAWLPAANHEYRLETMPQISHACGPYIEPISADTVAFFIQESDVMHTVTAKRSQVHIHVKHDRLRPTMIRINPIAFDLYLNAVDSKRASWCSAAQTR